MSMLTEFDRWFEKEYPSLYGAATGFGSWSASSREHASKTRRHMLDAWKASRAAYLEEAAKICDEMADNWNGLAQGARDGRYDFMAEAGDQCADEIRDVARAEGHHHPIDGNHTSSGEQA